MKQICKGPLCEILDLEDGDHNLRVYCEEVSLNRAEHFRMHLSGSSHYDEEESTLRHDFPEGELDIAKQLVLHKEIKNGNQ